MDLKPYKDIFAELTSIDGMILRGERIVVPTLLRDKIVEIALEGHQGIVRTKQILRAHVWFPGIDDHVQKLVLRCIPCQAVTPEYNREPLRMTPLPLGPWKNVSVYFAGPFGKRMALVLWDQYSRTPVVEFVSSTSAECAVPMMEKIFRTYGVTEEIKSDNGPPFNSRKFKEFTNEQGFRHRKWAEANGDVERFMRVVKKSAKVAKLENKNVEQAIKKTVTSYKATTHPATGYSPNKLFGRELKGKLPSVIEDKSNVDVRREVRNRDSSKKQQWKAYGDNRRNVCNSQIEMGDQVLIKQKRNNMLTPYYDPIPFTVIGIKGSMITAAREGEIKCRNSSHFKRLRRRDLIETFPENSLPVEPNNDKVIIDHTGQELLNDPTSGHEENEEVIPQDRSPRNS